MSNIEDVLRLINSGSTINAISNETGYTRTEIANILAEQLRNTTNDVKGNDHVVEKDKSDLEVNEEYSDSEDSRTISVKYSGKIKTVDEIISEIGLDKSEWVVSDIRYNEWQGQRPKDQGVITLRQVKFYLKKVGVSIESPLNLSNITINIPKYSVKNTTEHFIKTAVVIPDIQAGFKRNLITGELESLHDRRALQVALQLVNRIQPDRIIFLGDNLDFAEFSSKFNPTPEHLFTTQASLVELAYWVASFKNASAREIPIDYLFGNHCARMNKYLAEKANGVYGLRAADRLNGPAVLSVENLLGLEQLGITYYDYPNGVVTLNDNLVCVHGEIAKNAPGATVAELVKNNNYSIIQGHIHRYEVASKTIWDVFGNPKVITSASFGCLCKLDPGVVPGTKSRQNWQQGIGLVSYEDDGLQQFSHEFIPIQNGRAIFWGEAYEADSEEDIVDVIVKDTGFQQLKVK